MINGKTYVSTNLAKREIKDRNEIFTCMIAGAAGDGIMSAGNNFVKVLGKHHYHSLLYTEYPSLIRGGHNTVHIRVCKKNVLSQVSHIDALFAINLESVEIHIDHVTNGGIIIYDPAILRRTNVEDFDRPDISWRAIPLRDLVAEIGAVKIVQNTIGVAAICASIGLPSTTFKEVLTQAFAKKQKVLDTNLRAVDIAYDYAEKNFSDYWIKLGGNNIDSPNMTITGNQAVVAGMIAGGLGLFAGYPMSPATSILETMVRYGPKYNFQVIQTEDEIAAVMTVIGASHAGARAITATSGGGLSLMVEAIGLAASAEIPLVIVNVMRPGPSTGLPTWTGQSDLLFAINLGQDTFPRIVIAPGDVEEAYRMSVESLNYAEEYQVPVIMLTDKWLGSSYFTEKPFSNEGLNIRTGKTILLKDDKPEEEYKRYEITEDGISARALPGSPANLIFRTTGNEHDETGKVDDSGPNRIIQMEKRMRKLETISKAFPDPVIYGSQPSEADVTFFTWGSNKGIILDLIQRMPGTKISMVHVTHVWPFPSNFLANALDASKISILAEQNYDAQLGQLIRNHCLMDVDNKILRYDGRPFDPVDLERIVIEILGEHKKKRPLKATDNEIRNFLKSKGKIAIVGASTNSSKAGSFVPKYMIDLGFEIIPINPMVEELFGVKTLKSIDDLTEEVVGVIIYRKQEFAEAIAIKAINKRIPLIWLPLGITSEKAAQYARENNIIFVENKCPKIEGPNYSKTE